MKMREFVDSNFHHFNAGELKRCCQSGLEFLQSGGKLLVTIAGAMSTAEIGRTLSPLIRSGCIWAISTTGANLEEDIFKLVAKDSYHSISNWRELSPGYDSELAEKGLNRVTDTCIPEEEAIRKLESRLTKIWEDMDSNQDRLFPHEVIYKLVKSDGFNDLCEGRIEDSWVVAAAEKSLPIFVPGWEDSTSGNIFAAHCINGNVSNPNIIKSGTEYMIHLSNLYKENDVDLGFFQIGGGIAGDFPICVVPMLNQDLQDSVPLWKWFAQISDSTTSYGGYSGAPPQEKISWGKLDVNTPRFMIESDATIVAPILFSYLLES